MYNYLDFPHDDSAAAAQNGFQTIFLYSITAAAAATAAATQYEHSH